MVRVLLTIALAMIAATSNASDEVCEYIEIGGWSHHYDDDKDYQDVHYNIGCENILGSPITATKLENSYGWDTYMISYKYPIISWGSWDVSIMAGANHGYKDKGLDILGSGLSVHALPRLSYEGESIGFNVYMLYTSGIAFGMKIRL